MRKLGLKDAGCVADGALGHGHCRERLAALVEDLPSGTCSVIAPLARSLRGEMPDDCWDEEEALDLLNEHTTDGTVAYAFIDGDIVLISVEDLDA